MNKLITLTVLLSCLLLVSKAESSESNNLIDLEELPRPEFLEVEPSEVISEISEKVSEKGKILEDQIPYFHPNGIAEMKKQIKLGGKRFGKEIKKLDVKDQYLKIKRNMRKPLIRTIGDKPNI